MKPRKIKEILLDKGLTVADISREIQSDYPQVSEKSMYSMLYRMMFKSDYYPIYANELKTRYGIVINRPAPIRQQLRAS